MRLPEFIRISLLRRAQRLMNSRPPDFQVGKQGDRYMLRWYAIPRNKWMNIYVHLFLHDDDDVACHDHPWWSCSILLKDQYREILLKEYPTKSGGKHKWEISRYRKQGSITTRSAAQAHRIALLRPTDRPVTLFITGRTVREWGFHCPKGWVHFKQYTNKDDYGSNIANGCD